MRASRFLCCALLFLLWYPTPSHILFGQSATPITEVPVPAATGVRGRVDSSALNEVNQHLVAVGNVPWTGMQATGQIVFASDKTSYPATLTILGNRGFRMDAQTASGTLSIRINGRLGKIQEANGRIYPIVPDTAASGIFQFQALRAIDLTDRSVSLTDHGLATVDGISLHRMTMELSRVASANTSKLKPKAIVTDFYFDPQTHLLVKSANTIRIDGAGNNDFLRVVTYDDYRKVNGVMVPFRFTQTLDSQTQWTIQLSDVQLSSDKQSTFFEF